MQELKITVAVEGDPEEIRRRRLFEEFADTKRVSTMRLPLKDFAIPGDLALEKEIVLPAWVTRDAENINDELRVDFRAASAERLFPEFQGVLDVYPDDTTSIIELKGNYKPPLGVLGSAINTTIGYRIAQRSATEFLDDLAEQLSRPASPNKVSR